MSTARLRIQGIHSLPGTVPPDLAAALRTPPRLVSFAVDVSDYPGGQLTVIGLDPKTAAISHQQAKRLPVIYLRQVERPGQDGIP